MDLSVKASFQDRTTSLRLLLPFLALALLSWILVEAVFLLTKANLLTSDPLEYWKLSLTFNATFYDPFHLPVFMILIAGVRALFPFATPIVVLQTISLIAWLISVGSVYFILRVMRLPYLWLGVALYILFPFVGVTEGVFPRADTLAYCFLSLAILGYVADRKPLLIVGIAVGILVHKALWPFAFVLIVISLWQHRLTILQVVLSLVPALIYWLAGTLYNNHNPFWLFGSNLSAELTSRSQLPIFDGLIGTLLHGLHGSINDLVQGALMIALFALCIALLIWLFRSGVWREQPVLLVLTIPLVVLGLIVNQHEVWALLRFSRLLVVPLLVVAARYSKWRVFTLRPVYYLLCLGFCLVTQVFYAYYITIFTHPAV